MPNEEDQKRWLQLVKRAWADENLKQKLLHDPTPWLKEYGIEIPAGLQARVMADKDSISCLMEPQKPADDVTELTASDLSSVVGGGSKAAAQPVKYLEIKLTEVFVSSV